jgi:hypothetical protein
MQLDEDLIDEAVACVDPDEGRYFSSRDASWSVLPNGLMRIIRTGRLRLPCASPIPS